MNKYTNFWDDKTAAEGSLLLVYGETKGSKPAQIVFHEDAGHGWLQVPKSIIQDMGIADKITPFSYQDQNNFYLEEDCDMSLFLMAAGMDYDHGDAIKKLRRDVFFTYVDRQQVDYSPIRNMKPANTRKNENQLKFTL
jgi:hypothetical protein